MDKKELIVKGIGRTTAAPDLIVLTMNLEAGEPAYEKTMQRSVEMLDALRAAIVTAGHEGKELKTTSFNINTKYENYRENDVWKQQFVGYTCTHGLRLEFDLDMSMLGKTLSAIAGCDADPNFSIQFSIKDPIAVSELLLESAVGNAKQKATVLARAAGVKLGAIQRIDYSWSELRLLSETDLRLSDSAVAFSSAAPMSMDIEPEDIKVSDTATVVWAIE